MASDAYFHDEPQPTEPAREITADIPPMGRAPKTLRYSVEVRPPAAGERYFYEPDFADIEDDACLFVIEASHDHSCDRLVVVGVERLGGPS